MCENKLHGFKNNYTATFGMIEVPSYLSKMMMEWSKAAVRTRPSDLLRWSQIYFRMKANCEYPPVIPYLDTIDQNLGPGGLTPNVLKALSMTLSNESETYVKVEKIWDILSLDKKIFFQIIKIGDFDEYIKSLEFIGIAAAFLNNRLKDTMILLCNILSKCSNGISLEIFVTVYQYLARLNCTDVKDLFNNNFSRIVEDKINNLEGNSRNNSQCFSPLHSQSSSTLENELSCDTIIMEDTDMDINNRSSEGIMIWKHGKMDNSLSFTDILNNTVIQPPINTILCDNRNYVLSIKKLQGNDNDGLSLLSVSSVSSNSSIISFNSITSDIDLKTENINFEEHDNEEVVNYPLFSISDDNCDETNIQNVDNNENSIDDIISEVNDEISDMLKYEDNNSDKDIKSNNDKINNTDIKINTDFIVMLALVSDDNPPPNVEPNESVSANESEFSLLNDDLIVNTDERIDNVKVTDQIFEENYLINVGKESGDSETSSNSDEFQYSEIDQKSNLSLDKNSSKEDRSTSEILSEDDLASSKEKNKLSQLSINGEASLSTEFCPIDEYEDNRNYMYDENEKYLDYSKMSIVDSDKCFSEISDSKEKHILHYLPGVGEALPENQIKKVIEWVTKCAKYQNNYVYEYNLLHFLCPKLDNVNNCNDEPDIN